MVGKIRRPRQKLHAAAVKFVSQDGGPGEAGDKQTAQKQVAQQQTAQLQTAQPLECAANRASEQGAPPRPQADGHGSAAKGRPVLPSSIFSGTAIRLDQLVQNLNTESPAPAVCAAPEERKLQPKKLKMKERRERLLQKLSAFNLAREKERALLRRRATPVVGDMQVLADALPELSQLISTSRTLVHKKDRPAVKKKPEPTNFSQMKAGQKRKFLETESSRFSEALKDPTFKTNPLAAISEHLRKRLKEEVEQNPT